LEFGVHLPEIQHYMQKFLFLTLCFFTTTLLTAQPENWQRTEGNLEGFTIGSKWYTFVTDANLRSGPSTTASVITKLPIGALVTVDAVSTDSLTLRGVRLPWLQVSATGADGKLAKGFIWGGFMALASINTPADAYPQPGILYLTGVSAYNEAKHEITVQVRIAKDQKELSKVEFTTQGDLSYYPTFEVNFEPLSKVKAVIEVNYYYPACGYASGDNMLFWLDNNTLVKVLETSSVSEGGVFYENQESILPSQRGGIGDHVIVTRDFSQFIEKGNDYVRSKQEYSITLYKWNGLKLVKTKELK
jgi:hypothetical protein